MVSQTVARSGTGLNLGRPSKLRTLLILGRVSNLPTVWSNCLAGWWLGGGGKVSNLFLVSVWSSFLYVGGMFLNDAFDAGFDRNHRPTRPIPSGAITEREVWQWGLGWLAAGLAGLVWYGKTTATIALLLAACILLYNAVHKIVVIAPIFMGGCRLLVYLLAASVAFNGVTGETVWKGLALMGYIIGLSYLARKESARVRLQYWPCVFLTTPIFVALLVDNGGSRSAAIFLALLLAGWGLWNLSQTWGKTSPNVGRLISSLLAGIALVDWLAVGVVAQPGAVFFPAWFVLALLLQRFIPAT
jgi:4-hydroxybenzoate polyprenyltransferase